jgi:hypothetical protein
MINLKQIFRDLSSELNAENKNFVFFELNNTAITELEDNIFNDITFKFIYLNQTINLRHIYSNAFAPSNIKTIENFIHIGLSSIEERYTENLLKAINSLSRLSRLDFSFSELTTIPSQELDFSTQSQYLYEINFEGSRI